MSSTNAKLDNYKVFGAYMFWKAGNDRYQARFTRGLGTKGGYNDLQGSD
jgi:hypothetical protein